MDREINLPLYDAAQPVPEGGWYVTWGYGQKPIVRYASQGLTQWRDGMRAIPITHYAGPLPERKTR